MMPQPVAQEIVPMVGAVGDIVQAPLVTEILHIPAGNRKHGTDHSTVLGRDTPKALEAGTANQMHQHRFRVVVGGVGGGDLSGDGTQETVPGIPGRSLQALLAGDDIAMAHGQGNVIAVAEIPDELFVPIRFRAPEMVVEMGRSQGDPQLVLQKIQGKEQRHGIGPAGYGAGDLVPGLQQLLLPDKGKELIQHASTPGP